MGSLLDADHPMGGGGGTQKWAKKKKGKKKFLHMSVISS